ncbi:DUF1513 domain-containing protein [Vibrio viridaestus]|uniref:DUF1513 domain-containing protein n=1 Tax=Vibrio viridaestus TaxID=2487322 RepID=A0A3N9THV0_9VIBR|nr:DUF1513 domain-containing protein [Vibrio viridaestus]RQW63474.1 DUF1513 domain-containing protein [Vibrio viridaestus]
MQLMVTDNTRRDLLKLALAGMTVPLLPFGCTSAQDTKTSPALIGCSIGRNRKYYMVVANQDGIPIHQVLLPARGHGVAISPISQHAVAFGRRPGTFMMVIDYVSGKALTLLPSKPDRHFYGHGVYSHDGQWLYTTEGVKGTSEGIVGVYDTFSRYKKVDEFRGFGIGPHEIILKADGTLVVGVGGVDTDGRTPKNIATMKPSLTYLSSTGFVLEQVSLSDHHLSIRHLAHDGNETVLCGQQYRGEPDSYPSLIAMHQPGKPMLSLRAEPEEWARFHHYIASIAANEKWILATSPPGSCYGIWSKTSGELVELASLPDASGVVVHDDAFLISSGSANVVTHHYPEKPRYRSVNVQWDNHWSAIAT